MSKSAFFVGCRRKHHFQIQAYVYWEQKTQIFYKIRTFLKSSKKVYCQILHILWVTKENIIIQKKSNIYEKKFNFKKLLVKNCTFCEFPKTTLLFMASHLSGQKIKYFVRQNNILKISKNF